ncbi:CAAX protease self-immunity [Thermoactinomyces sp. DSM 45891]|uniref:CPBP family intramembrane glutamic endopeptidase n=1 Tax=Thermoactinomyces sp. DSM 45891 TaxID=1761907 RepID=UPI00091CBBD4|nr:type II CAAX endopeptidase family protein [Thermoactinomyces sp. DSM 45891]SFX62840.1 CAAX protease self-immunity [Thermoactinomyces sp. DSM 45891]
MNDYTEIIFLIASFSLLILLAYLVNKVDYTIQVKGTSSWNGVSHVIQALYGCMYLLVILIALLATTKNIYTIAVILFSALGLSFLIPAVRKGLARLIPINPNSHVHTFALLTSIFIPTTLFQSLIMPTSLADVQQETITLVSSLSSLWAQNILCAVFAIMGVGYLTRRNWKQTRERLGLYRLTFKQLLGAIAVAIVFVVLQSGLTIVFTQLGLSDEQEVLKVNEALMAPLFNSVIGIISIGLAAALGEELVFRGALQPRFGIILTSILFALTHSNYGLSIGTIVVLVLGFGMGYFRKRCSTTYTMVIHASYNIMVGALGYFFP